MVWLSTFNPNYNKIHVFLQPKDRDTACLRNSTYHFWHTMNQDLHKWASYLCHLINKRNNTYVSTREQLKKKFHYISYSEGLPKFVNTSRLFIYNEQHKWAHYMKVYTRFGPTWLKPLHTFWIKFAETNHTFCPETFSEAV